MKEFVYQIAAGEADTILIADESGNIIYVDNPQKKIPLVLVWEGDKRVWVDNTDGSNKHNTLKYEDLLNYIKELEERLETSLHNTNFLKEHTMRLDNFNTELLSKLKDKL